MERDVIGAAGWDDVVCILIVLAAAAFALHWMAVRLCTAFFNTTP